MCNRERGDNSSQRHDSRQRYQDSIDRQRYGTANGNERSRDREATHSAQRWLHKAVELAELRTENTEVAKDSDEHTTPSGREKRMRGWPLLKLRRPPRMAGGPAASCSWGALRFPHAASGKGMGLHPPPSKWVAIDADSSVNHITNLLTTTWQLRWPDVIISVTGAAAGNMPALQDDGREAFQLGLLGAVRATNAWVVTGGTDGGVMELVGKMMARQVRHPMGPHPHTPWDPIVGKMMARQVRHPPPPLPPPTLPPPTLIPHGTPPSHPMGPHRR
jgi:hypothetical protein